MMVPQMNAVDWQRLLETGVETAGKIEKTTRAAKAARKAYKSSLKPKVQAAPVAEPTIMERKFGGVPLPLILAGGAALILFLMFSKK